MDSLFIKVGHEIRLIDPADFLRMSVMGYSTSTVTVTNQNYYAVDGGSANTISISLSPTPSGWTSLIGKIIIIQIAANNTGATTIAISGCSGTKAVKKQVSLPLDANDLLSGGMYEFIYDGTNVQLFNLPSIAGSQIIAEPVADHTVSGITTTLTAGEALAFGDVCFINDDGKAQLINATAIATMFGVVMAAGTINANEPGIFLLLGIARDDSWNWLVGLSIFGANSAGVSGCTITQTPQSATDHVVQILGVATHAHRMLFNPQFVQVELI
jgi:hypothetical protein